MTGKQITDISENLSARMLRGVPKKITVKLQAAKISTKMWLTSPTVTTSYPGRLKSS